jgi:hypothetical protein
MPVQIQIRNGTAAQWTSANPVLAAGEVGIETDTRKQKFGDGTTAWNSLAYAGGTGTVTGVTGTSPVVSSGGAAPAISLASGYGDTQNPYASKTANFVLAAPNGSANVPSFRALVSADIPTLNQNTTGTAAGLSATLAVASGGTGLTSTPANGALDIGNGTGFTRTTLTAGSNVTITNGAGSITIASTGGGGGTPGGANTNIQFNSSSTFGGSANLTWDGTNVQLGGAGALRLADSDNSNYASFQSPATLAANTAYTLPTALPTANGSTLVATTAGVMSWSATGPSAPSTVEYLVVGGGGGSAGSNAGVGGGGGGGAGGFRTASGFSVSAGVGYTVTVGGGGSAGGTNTDGTKGSDSVFSSITSTGGGFGSISPPYTGGSGGSGGGGSAAAGSNGGAGNTPSTSPSQGSNGGGGANNAGPFYGAGGGGGASAVGTAGTGSVAGNGGNGTASSITGSSVTYAGGGGGGITTGGTAGTGGSGGGGNAGSAGTTNRGGGGGGGNVSNATGSAGGSGIVVIAYPSTSADLASIGGGLTYTKTTVGGNTIYTFTAGTGTIQW